MQNNYDSRDTGILGPRQKALIDQLAGGKTGIGGAIDPGAGMAGGTAVSVPPVQAPANAQANLQQMIGLMGPSSNAASANAPAQDFSRLAGYDAGKFNDPNKKSAKYQIGRTLAGFDPTQGVNADVLTALNGLGFGNFSGSGDKLSLAGLTDAGRNAGLTGDYSGADFIQGFKSGNGKWGYADPVAEAASARQTRGPASAPSLGGGMSLPGVLQGDPNAAIQQALQNVGGMNQPGLLQQLIAALGGSNG